MKCKLHRKGAHRSPLHEFGRDTYYTSFWSSNNVKSFNLYRVIRRLYLDGNYQYAFFLTRTYKEN